MSTDNLSKYSSLWTDIDNYALLPLSGDISEHVTGQEEYDICAKYPGGYEILSIDAKYIGLVISKMLTAGVKIIAKRDIDEANQPYHLWTDRLHEFVLVRLTNDPMRKMIYSRKFRQYLTFAIWPKGTTLESVIQKMIEAGVKIVDEKNINELIEGCA